MIHQKYRKCKICEIIGGWFVTRSKKLASGKVAIYPDNMCLSCARDIAKTNYYKRRKNPQYVEKERKRLRDYKRNHPDKIRAQAKIYWIKNKEEITMRRNLKKEKTENIVNKLKRNSHHRVPSNNHPLRGFDFRSIKTLKGE